MIGSPSHNAACFTLDCIGKALCVIILPILPHLVIEYYSHHPLLKNQCSTALRQSFFDISNSILSKEIIFETSDKIQQIFEEEKINLLMNNCIFKIRANIASQQNNAKKKKNLQKMVVF